MVVTLVFGALTTLALGILAAVLGHPGRGPFGETVSVASSTLAWGPGVMLAVAGAMGAITQDKTQGIVALARFRGVSHGHYLGARTLGLAALTALVVAGGTLVVAVVALSFCPRTGLARLGQWTVASLLYALCFSSILPPLCLAVLGTGSRFLGYLQLLAILVVPEILSRAASEPWAEVLSLPGALSTLRSAVMQTDLARFGRALLVLVVSIGLCATVLRSKAMQIEATS